MIRFLFFFFFPYYYYYKCELQCFWEGLFGFYC